MLLVAITCKPKRYSLTLLPPGHTVNSDVAIHLLKDTRRRFSQVRRNPIAQKDMVLLWDNARLHICSRTTTFLKQAKIQQLKQSPYSPDLNILWQISIRKTEVWDEGGHPGLSWRRYVGRKTATRPDIGKGAGESYKSWGTTVTWWFNSEETILLIFSNFLFTFSKTRVLFGKRHYLWNTLIYWLKLTCTEWYMRWYTRRIDSIVLVQCLITVTATKTTARKCSPRTLW